MSTQGVLIVSASTGTGHRRAGEALRTAFQAGDPDEHVEHIDLLTLAPRWVQTMYGNGYELMATRAPWLWSQVYRYTDGNEYDRARWSALADRLLFREFRRLLLSRNWRHCVCTHFLPCQLAAGRPDHPPFSLVITDFTLHRIWVQTQVRRYFVATEQLGNDIRQRLPSADVTASGIPIDPAFATAPRRNEARLSLRIDPRARVVVVIGGGLGLGVGEMARAVLRATARDLQVIALCGRNEADRQELLALGVPPSRLRAEKFVTNVQSYLAASDFVVTKPGGLTTSEALALGRPIIFGQAIPGQETGNARTVAGAGAALCAGDPGALTIAAEQLLRDDRLLMGLAASATRLSRPRAAESVVARLSSNRLFADGGNLEIAQAMPRIAS